MHSLANKDEEDAFYTHDSNRSVAVIWAAIVENRLTDVIKAAMRKDEKIASELFNPSGPLGNFGTKIRLSYMLGIVGKDLKEDLLMINKIRNDFAHRVDVKDFESSPVTNYMQNLHIVKAHQELLQSLKKKRKTAIAKKTDQDTETKIFILEQELSDNRSQYHMSIRYLIHTLVAIEKEINDSRRIYATRSQDSRPDNS